MAAAISVWLRRGAVGVAVGRTGIGIVALARPALLARPWVGAAAGGAPVRVLSRALAGRDLVLGLGALAALWRHSPAGGSVGPVGPARAWVGAGALSDAFDVASTAACWDELPAWSRYLVAASAAGAAATGAAAALSLARRHAASA